jgi:hypothetical protein
VKLILYLFVIITFSFLLASCDNKNDKSENTESNSSEEDTVSVSIDNGGENNNPIDINYSFFHINNSSDLDSFKVVFNDTQRRIISDINRIDERRIKTGDSVVVSHPLLDSLYFYSPFPTSISSSDSINKLLLISRRIQAIAGYENGNLVRWFPTSTGKKSTPTPDGLFFTNWKARSTISTVNEEWLMKWYFNIHNFRGISIHEYAMPGYPASHACLRLKEEDAIWFYNWADQWILSPDEQKIEIYGTPVIIYDEYDFESTPPWKYLVVEPEITRQKETELNELINKYLKEILEKQSKRDSLQVNVI